MSNPRSDLTPARAPARRTSGTLARALLAAAALCAVAPLGFAGTWTKLTHNPPGAVNLMLLLPDGTVMAARQGGSIGKGWYRLTPDSSGSYVNGTWSTLASMIDTRLYYGSQVLRDGRVLVMPVSPHTSGIGLIYDPVANTWSNAGKLKHGSNEVEAAWAKLPDDSILVIDFFSTTSERYIAATNTWINDANVPVSIYDNVIGEMGGALLLPNGKGFFIGASGHNALYTPSGSTAAGSWVAGPDFPNGQGAPDAPAAMMVDGKVLCAVSAIPTPSVPFASPTSFYEYDPFANGFTQVSAPVGMSDNTPAYTTAMLDLPDGKVLYSHMGAEVYVYQPSGAPLAAGKPAITGITQNLDGSWHLTGTGLNGISQGATYGDDLQMDSNYPLVRLTSGATVRYARTFDWSSTGVMTGAAPVSTEFSTAGVPAGNYSLVVVANGIASDPVPFTQPNFASWTTVGPGFSGITGIPVLLGTGSQIAGQPAALNLTNANTSAPAVLFVGLASNPTPFKGGTLVPVPAQIVTPLVTGPTGAIALPFVWPAGLPSGFSLYYQFAIQDGGAFFGVALSNALRSTTL